MRHSSDRRYENIPDPESDISLPVVTITDFATGEAGKEVILLIAGEHARELITSEIAFWLGKLLAGKPLYTNLQIVEMVIFSPPLSGQFGDETPEVRGYRGDTCDAKQEGHNDVHCRK